MGNSKPAVAEGAIGLAWVSLIGNAAFVAIAIGLPYAQPGYRLSRDAVSVLALGPYGWVQTIAFCALGIGTVALAGVIAQTTSSRGAAVALGVAGALNFIAAGVHTVRVGQHQTPASVVHNLCGVVTFVLTVVAMALLVRGFRRSTGWAPMAAPSRLWVIVAVVVLVLTAPLAKHFGIAERLLLATLVSWMLACSAYALTALRPGAVAHGALSSTT